MHLTESLDGILFVFSLFVACVLSVLVLHVACWAMEEAKVVLELIPPTTPCRGRTQNFKA